MDIHLVRELANGQMEMNIKVVSKMDFNKVMAHSFVKKEIGRTQESGNRVK